MGAILTAIRAGFPGKTVLNQFKHKFPQYAHYINTAQNAGYTANYILKSLTNDKHNSADAYLTEHEQIQKRDKQQKRRAALGLVGAAGTAGAIAAGAYSAAIQGGAVQPSAILPAQRRQPPAIPGGTINIRPRPRGGPPRLPGAQARGLPAPKAAKGMPPAAPETPPPQTPELNIFQRKGAEINQLWDLAQKGKTGGNQFLKTANKLIKSGTVTDATNFTNFYNWWKATEGQPRSNPLVEYEKFRVQTRGMFDPSEVKRSPIQPSGVEAPPQEELGAPQMVSEAQQKLPIEAQRQTVTEEPEQQAMPFLNIRERTQQAVFGDRPELKRKVDSSFKGKEFAVPTYKFPGESSEDFSNRKIINEAIKKTAKAISEGKSFLDFGPISPEVLGVGGLSTAEDVLRFMAGIPNVYDPLLDDEEKQELYNGLMESGEATIEGLRPGEGEQNVYGAQMTPNMIWNLLLTIEPRLYKMERPKAIKGSTKPGQKMDSTGFRRYLTHAVYGALSGKNISTDLADKIGKISSATSSLDVIAKAAQDGNFNKVLKEIERLSEDDTAFFALFTDEVENMARAARGKKVTVSTAVDTRGATEIRKKLGKPEPPKGEYAD